MSETASSAHPLQARILAPGPKRILSCDGGGIRGMISVEILAEIESLFRSASGNPDARLNQFFDFVCGTSTGAIIAACISAGMSTGQIRRFYEDSGQDMFDKASILKRLKFNYDAEPLARTLQKALNAALGRPEEKPWAELGDPGLKSVLMMVMRNHSTDSPWFVSNNPLAKYNKPDRPDCNLRLPLWQLVRASTAAPTYFPPEVVTLGEGSSDPYNFIFVDGGVTTYNNPAYMAFQMATAAPYRMNWKTGERELLIVSVGTGKAPSVALDVQAEDMDLLYHARTVPDALMNAATDGWDLACRTLGRCLAGDPIDREVGTMVMTDPGASTSTGPKLFTYVRYNALLTRLGLDALGLRDVHPDKVRKLDAVDNMPQLKRIGQACAAAQVRASHFEGFMPGAASRQG